MGGFARKSILYPGLHMHLNEPIRFSHSNSPHGLSSCGHKIFSFQTNWTVELSLLPSLKRIHRDLYIHWSMGQECSLYCIRNYSHPHNSGMCCHFKSDFNFKERVLF